MLPFYFDLRTFNGVGLTMGTPLILWEAVLSFLPTGNRVIEILKRVCRGSLVTSTAPLKLLTLFSIEPLA